MYEEHLENQKTSLELKKNLNPIDDLISETFDQVEDILKIDDESILKFKSELRSIFKHDLEILKLVEDGNFNQKVFEKLIEKKEYIFLFSVTEYFSNINYTEIAIKLIEKGKWNIVVNDLEKFKWINYLNIASKLIEKGDWSRVINNIEKFQWLTIEEKLKIWLQVIKNWNAYLLAENLDKFEGLDHIDLAKKIIDFWKIKSIVNNIEKFKGLNKEIALIFIKSWEWETLAKNQESFENLWKLWNFLSKIKNREDDLEFFTRYWELSKIEWFDEIFDYYIENKQKSIIELMQKLLIAKDIWIKTNFKLITDLLDVSWIKSTELKKTKEKLEKTFDKLERLSWINRDKQWFLKFLQITKNFDDFAIEQVKKYFSILIEDYFNMIYDKKVKQKFVNELNLRSLKNLDEILKKEEFIEAFKMYQKTDINKKQFKEIILNSIYWDKDFVLKLEKNQKWLNSTYIKDKNMSLWQEENEQIIDIWEDWKKVDKTKDIEQFLQIANNKLELFWLKKQEKPWKLVNYFNTEVKKNKENLKKNSGLSDEEFENIYNDLVLQVSSINNLFKETKAREVTKIKIYKENDPLKILMMWNLVDWSCFNFYSKIWNYWATATDALDINKWVFYIEDQNWEIIWRTLIAIDNYWKIVRFWTYLKWNIEVDLDKYFDEYIKWLCTKIWLWINWDIKKVELLNWEKWYRDPVWPID